MWLMPGIGLNCLRLLQTSCTEELIAWMKGRDTGCMYSSLCTGDVRPSRVFFTVSGWEEGGGGFNPNSLARGVF